MQDLHVVPPQFFGCPEHRSQGAPPAGEALALLLRLEYALRIEGLQPAQDLPVQDFGDRLRVEM